MGGYMSIYHEMEEFCYGPKIKLSAKAKVFFCLRHKLLRDGLKKKQIGKKFICEKTGLTFRQVQTALKALEEDQLILVSRHSIGKVFFENEYELNSKTFPYLLNWYKDNPQKEEEKVIHIRRG
jgi:predicted transcriptional regulator